MLKDLTPRKALAFAIETERLGIESYRRLADRFRDDDEIFRVFGWLATDEEDHEKQFSALLELLPEESGPEDQEGYLRAISVSEFFSNRAGLTRGIDGIQTRQDALRRALELEKATLSYYVALREFVGDAPVLDKIIEAEEGHVMVVTKLLTGGPAGSA